MALLARLGTCREQLKQAADSSANRVTTRMLSISSRTGSKAFRSLPSVLSDLFRAGRVRKLLAGCRGKGLISQFVAVVVMVVGSLAALQRFALAKSSAVVLHAGAGQSLAILSRL
jgi:hypothetical protein